METSAKSTSPNYYSSTKDTTYTKLFVGGLPYHTCDKGLRDHFERYGDIDEAVVIVDKVSLKSRGYGFVTMADREGAQRAIANPNPVIDGRKANVNLAFLGAKQRGNPTIDYPASLQQFLALKAAAAGWQGNFMQTGQSAYPTAGLTPYAGMPMYFPSLIPYPSAAATSPAPSAVSPTSGTTGHPFWDYTALANAQASMSNESAAAAQLAAFPYMSAAAAAAAANPLQQQVSPMSYYIPANAQSVAAQSAYQSQQLSADQLH